MASCLNCRPVLPKQRAAAARREARTAQCGREVAARLVWTCERHARVSTCERSGVASRAAGGGEISGSLVRPRRKAVRLDSVVASIKSNGGVFELPSAPAFSPQGTGRRIRE